MTTATENTRRFEAEVSQVLDLVINSLYSNKEIFLRELISNSADAISKLRFESLANKDLVAENTEFKIKLSVDKEAKKIILQDNGIGMNQDDLVNNLGTIAKSGTKEFLNALKTSKDQELDASLIGQFGVGFYSAFIVAEKLTVISRKAGEKQINTWISEGKGEYQLDTLEESKLADYEIEELSQGTAIIMEIKDDEECTEFLNDWRVSSVVKKYSDFIEYPIKFKTQIAKKDEEGNDTEEMETVWEILNSQKALWSRPKNEITDEEYKDFYKHVSNDFNDPADWIHYRAEGTNEFTALLYLPEKAPMNMLMPDAQQKGISLYINNVFITSDHELLTPQYLRFVKGVIDSSDLPLNVSRELLQENPRVAAIKKNISKKILSRLEELKKKESEKYENLYKQFGKMMKEGLHTDFANREKLLDLVLFESTKTEAGKLTSLAEYVERADSAQKEIYFIAGESRKDLENSPYLEALKEKNIEVLFFTDHIDEWVLSAGVEYKEKQFKSATKGDLDIDSNKEEIEKKQEEHKDLLEKIKADLSENVAEVKLSDRLTTTLCCLVRDETGMSANMERIYAAMQQAMPKSKAILELNASHPVVAKMSELYTENKDDAKLKDYADLIYGQALLLEGSKIEDLPRFTSLISELMV